MLQQILWLFNNNKLASLEATLVQNLLTGVKCRANSVDNKNICLQNVATTKNISGEQNLENLSKNYFVAKCCGIVSRLKLYYSGSLCHWEISPNIT